MQVRQISKLKNFGIFSPISANNRPPEFKKFNLVYGWNRCGKTTLSRVFFAVSEHSTEFQNYPEQGEFSITLEDGSTVDHTQLKESGLTAKVFNQDFIDKYLSFGESGKHCDIIVYLSDEDKELVRILEEKRSEYKVANQNLLDIKEKEKSLSGSLDKLRITMASDISDHISNREHKDHYFSYNKAKVKKALAEFPPIEENRLPDSEVQTLKETIISGSKDEVEPQKPHAFNLYHNGETLYSAEQISQRFDALCGRIVQGEIIEKLAQDKDINKWVKDGYFLHKQMQQDTTCLFCEKSLSKDILARYAKHFNEEYDRFIVEIDNFIASLQKTKISTGIVNQDIYPDLKAEYHKIATSVADAAKEVNNSIDEMISQLNRKRDSPFEEIVSETNFRETYRILNSAVVDLSAIQELHNERASNHLKEILDIKRRLELHLLYTKIQDNNYHDSESELKAYQDEIGGLKTTLEELKLQIKKYEEKTSSVESVIPVINHYLEGFFGKDEIRLKLTGDKRGYIVLQNGEPAKSLSEGEKTAIAFSYFLSKINENGAKIEKSIIFIDDPISSLDSNFIFHGYSLIKHHFANASQLIVSTHNFEFLSLMKDWFIQLNKNRVKKQKAENAELFMIENEEKNGPRFAQIKLMESTIANFRSEYQYLFFLLRNFLEKDAEYSEFYTIGNIARRYLEVFCSFKIPDSANFRNKLDQLIKMIKGDKTTAIALERLYKLVNVHSHNQDPTSTMKLKETREVKDAIRTMFTIVQESDPKHYQIMKRNLR